MLKSLMIMLGGIAAIALFNYLSPERIHSLKEQYVY